MLGTVLGVLEWAHQFSDPLAWLVVAAFLLAAALDVAGRDPEARYTAVAGWVLFAAFWLSLIHYYAITSKSIVEGIGSLVAVPGSLYAGYLLARGRDSLLVLSRAVGGMALVFLTFESITPVRNFLIEEVTRQTEFAMGLVGQTAPEDFRVVSGSVVDRPDLRSTFLFMEGDHRITYTIRIACTGLGSIAIFAGAIAAVRAPVHRKVRALAVSVPVIYVLNIVRNTFIGLSFGQQRLQLFPGQVMTMFASNDPYMVSYFIADRILAQVLSVVALVGITWLVVRELPEITTILEDALFMLTGTEYDLQAAIAGSGSGSTEE
ncbi:archaeosortase A [Halomarina litorea]|uniref:archaeosortase A n=1 Tax=Halomarina litorea TaxID=2961595 RepID=UPI0020C36002|nr:archaeosortase A [Halomarina sp. BCD28]